MGYETAYVINASYRGTDSHGADPHTIERLHYAINDLYGGGWEGSYVDGWFMYGKWYDHEDDMIRLSEEYPEFLFEMHGDGEDSEDFWIEYFQDGKCQYCQGTIVYEEFDPGKMVRKNEIIF